MTEKAIDAEPGGSKVAERSSAPTRGDRLEPKPEHTLAGGTGGSAAAAPTGSQLQRQLGNAAGLRLLGSGQTLKDQPTPAALGNSATVRLLQGASTASPPEPSQARSGSGVAGGVLAQPLAVSGHPMQGTASSGTPTAAPSGATRVGFVREEGLNLREGPDQAARSLAQLRFGTRVHILEDESQHPSWHKVAVLGGTGFLYAPRIHFPPPALIEKDPALGLIRVKHGQTFWGLVKEQYGIQGNEGTFDQNINHFINAIRAVNKPEAFKVETDLLDDIGNAIISGRDASDTLLKADVDLWIPSFGVAARMDVGSGTVTGEIARIIKKIEQKIADFKTAGLAALKYIPGAVLRHAGEVGKGLLTGLIDFAIDAAKILVISTAVGALLGAVFGGGAGAIPGAKIGFEIGLLILEYYGLGLLIEMVLSIAGNLLSQLGHFISLVWNANGDEKVLEEAGKTLADALGILASAALLVLAAYLMKKGSKAFGKTKFAKTVGETQLAKWLAERQKMTTTREALKPPPEPTAKPVSEPVSEPVSKPVREALDRMEQKIADADAEIAAHQPEVAEAGAKVRKLHEERMTARKTDPGTAKGKEELKLAQERLKELQERQKDRTRENDKNRAVRNRLQKALDAKTYDRPPSFTKAERDTVWRNAQDVNGKVFSPSGKEIKPGDPWIMGHKPKYEFRKHVLSAARRAITREQFLKECKEPGQYRPETPEDSSSHFYEDKTDAYLGP